MEIKAITQAVSDVAINLGEGYESSKSKLVSRAIIFFANRYNVLRSTGNNFTGPVAAIAGAGPALTFTDGTPARISSMSSQYDN
jgi:hypothetical protein